MEGRSRLRALLRPGTIALLIVVALLAGFRVALPGIVTRHLNALLADIPGHVGEVDNVDIHLWRGAYAIRGLRLDQIEGTRLTPLFNSRDVHLSVEWLALLHGRLVGEIVFVHPQMNIVSPPRPEALKHKGLRIQDMVERFRRFLPLDINHFAAVDGELRFQDVSAGKPVDLYFDRIQLKGDNLTNSERLSQDLWATVSGTGRAMGSGAVRLEMRLNPNEKRPTYDLAFELEHLRLTAINDYLKHYLAVVARDGELSLYAESRAHDGRFTGYVKPIVKDLDILHIKKEPKTAGEAIEGFFAKLMAQVFENKPRQQLATKIDFSGTFSNPEVGVWDAVVTFVQNAFVQALSPGLDESVAPRQAERAKSNDRTNPGAPTPRKSP